MINKYYQMNKKKLRKEARERYQNVSEEENEKRRKKAQDRYQNLSEEEKEKKRQYHPTKNLSVEDKQKKVEYMRNYYLVHKK